MFEIYRRAGRIAVEEETEKESTNSFTTTIREIRQETRSSLRFLLRPSFSRLIIKVRATIHAKEIFRTNGQRTWLKESRTDDVCSMLLVTKDANFFSLLVRTTLFLFALYREVQFIRDECRFDRAVMVESDSHDVFSQHIVVSIH